MSIEHRRLARMTLLLVLVWPWSPTGAQISLDGPPIDYFKAPLDNPITRLARRLESGEAALRHGERGYLDSLLENLGISTTSQVLVFTKTSFQLRRISPRTPRAVYFSDDIYVGWVQGGDVVEISAVDNRQGAIFYTLDQKESSRPEFKRRKYECLQCHSSTLTKDVPGHVVRSVYSGFDGLPILSAGTFITDHTSPLEERWGGWYVSGRHGEQRHLGNLMVGSDKLDSIDMSRGSNVTDLDSLFRTSPYITPHSDIVALMILEHQTQAQNLITRASYLTRTALQDQRVINEMLGEPADRRTPSTTRRIKSAADPLVKYLLFCDETRLTAPIRGASGFAENFAARGRRDKRGRSLRDFDLKTRLFKYPLSYLIHSAAFKSLPDECRRSVEQSIESVLKGNNMSDDFKHLSTADRQAILEILKDTRSGAEEPKRDMPKRRAEL